MKISEEIIAIIEEMIVELKTNVLAVVLTPDQFGDEVKKLRQAESQNPEWYKELCSKFIVNRERPRRRKKKFHDTRIRRKNILNIMEVMVRKGKSRSCYAPFLIEIAEKRLPEYCEYQEFNEDASKMTPEELENKWGRWYLYGDDQ